MRILLVSQMYPGPDDPDLGAFVAQLEHALEARGHELERAVLDSRGGGKRRYLTLARRARAASRRFGPDVVYAHFLVPAGLIASFTSRAPLVVTAHGRDVRNVGAVSGIRSLTRLTVRRASTVIAVSDYLRRELETKVPEARGKTEVIDSGVDLERFHVEPPPDGEADFLCLGSLTERKNVVRLAEAFERLGTGKLTFVGDGPLRPQLEGRERVDVVPSAPHDQIPDWIARSRVVCQPSLVEPFGQAVLEALACGRSVVATRVGGPPEFVPPDAGVLVDPLDIDELTSALETAAGLPCPNLVARAAAERHDLAEQARRVEHVLERAARIG
ncbi:MAG TPA: glycosyltransferase [Gaiellaceae bacterium]|jgi:glycosyltransferase involved in cell wall biosynthesis